MSKFGLSATKSPSLTSAGTMSGECYGAIVVSPSRKRARELDDEHEFVVEKRRQLAALFSSNDQSVLFQPCDWDASDSFVAEVLRILEEHPYIPDCAEEGDDDKDEQGRPFNRLECKQVRLRCWLALTGSTNVTTLSGTHDDLKPQICAILHAMAKFSNHASLLACGCHDLILMAPEQPMIAHQQWARWIDEFGGVQISLNVMSSFVDNEEVQDLVTRLLYLLVMPGLCTRSNMIRENPTSALLRVMQQHPSKEDLCCDIGWTLCSLLSDESNRITFVQDQGVLHFINIMGYHFDSGRIQEPCLLGLIDVFQYHDIARLQFLAMGGAELLTRTLDQHAEKDDVVHAVVAVLFKVYHDMNEAHQLSTVIQGIARVFHNGNLRAKVQQNAMHWLFHASEVASWRSSLMASEENILSILAATGENRPVKIRYHGLFMLLDFALEPSCRKLILDNGGMENIMALPKVCRDLSLEDPHFWQMLQRRMTVFLLEVDAGEDDLTKKAFHGGFHAVLHVVQSMTQPPS